MEGAEKNTKYFANLERKRSEEKNIKQLRGPNRPVSLNCDPKQEPYKQIHFDLSVAILDAVSRPNMLRNDQKALSSSVFEIQAKQQKKDIGQNR